MQDSVTKHNWSNMSPGSDPIDTCKAHCSGYDYFGMSCAGQGAGMYCTCLSSAEFDAASEERPIYECLGECSHSSSAVCNDRSADGSRVDTNCPGMDINGVVYSAWEGYALGASWRTAYYPMVEDNAGKDSLHVSRAQIAKIIPKATQGAL